MDDDVEIADLEGTAQGDRADVPAELLARLPDRDPEALQAFFDVYFDRVHAYVRRLVRDEHTTEDLTQEVFLHVYRSLPSYDATRDLRPWVFTIATNKVRDLWRSRRHRDSLTETSVERDGAIDALQAGDPAPGRGLVDRELDAHLHAALEELPEGMRVTVLLRIHEGLSFEAIGRILDRNEVAVRKRYSRALEALRTSLGATYRLYQEGT